MLQGRFGLDQQVFALVFGAGAVALIGATQFNVVLLKRFAPQVSGRVRPAASALLAPQVSTRSVDATRPVAVGKVGET